MSTRCQIQVEGSAVSIYRHSDGYPGTKDGVVAALKPICEEFLKYRGWDEESMVAQICARLVAAAHANIDEFYDNENPFHANRSKEDREAWIAQSKCAGYGLCTELHWDIEYLYVVTREGIKIRRGEGAPFQVVKFGEAVDFDTL